MKSAAELEREVTNIKERNKRVEADKAWEVSWTRKILIVILTYFVIVLFLYVVGLPKPVLNSVIPTLGFILSTLSLTFCKKIWLKYRS